MENSTVKHMGFLQGLIVSLFLLAGTFGAVSAQASQANQQPLNGAQLAWWGGGGFHHGWGGGWHHGWGGGWGGGYYNSGWGYNNGPVCSRHCWRNNWGQLHCASNCY